MPRAAAAASNSRQVTRLVATVVPRRSQLEFFVRGACATWMWINWFTVSCELLYVVFLLISDSR